MSITRISPFGSVVVLALAGGIVVPAAAQATKLVPPARVTLQLDSTTVAQFDVRTFDLGVAQNPPSHDQAVQSTAEIQLVKQAGPYTGDLVRLSASGERAPSGTIEVLDSLGAPSMTIRLTDVSVVSDHLTSSNARAALEQQRISLQESLAQLTADYTQAERDLATAEELGKSKVMTKQDVLRAREHAAELQQRINLARERQNILAAQMAGQGALEENVVLHFGRIEIQAPDTGGTMSWDFSARAQSADSVSRKPSSRSGRARSLRP
ncbi:MAG TPA: hypothetical protein VHB25_16630 [Gemmatimonadaceae bacterium]|nr:hypothetical protein [Gemmatimonadaceae bacterium]